MLFTQIAGGTDCESKNQLQYKKENTDSKRGEMGEM